MTLMTEAPGATTDHGGARLRQLWLRLVRLTEQVMGEPARSTEGGYSVRAQDWTPTARGITLAEVEDALDRIDEDAMQKASESLGGGRRTG